MKKINEKLTVKDNDCITIYNAARREERDCFYKMPCSLSVKKYFACSGRNIKELYGFKAWYNKKLTSVVAILLREPEHSLNNTKTVAARQEVICYER